MRLSKLFNPIFGGAKHVFEKSKIIPIKIQQTFPKYAELVARATVIRNGDGNAIFKIN